MEMQRVGRGGFGRGLGGFGRGRGGFGRGGGGGDRLPQQKVPETILFSIEVFCFSTALLATVMIKWLGKNHRWSKFALSSWMLLMAIYGVYLLIYRGWRVFVRGGALWSDAFFGTAVILMATISVVNAYPHVMKIHAVGVAHKADNWTDFVLAAISFDLVLIAAVLRQAGK